MKKVLTSVLLLGLLLGTVGTSFAYTASVSGAGTAAAIERPVNGVIPVIPPTPPSKLLSEKPISGVIPVIPPTPPAKLAGERPVNGVIPVIPPPPPSK